MLRCQENVVPPAKAPVQNDEDARKKKKLRKKIKHLQTVLDDLVSVNSLFTFAMFIGISFASANPHSLESRKECQTSQRTRMLLLFDEVVSFVCFLLSSIVATALKVHLSTHDDYNQKDNTLMDGLRSFMITVSVASSVLGCVYLTLSMFNVVRVLLGNITCGESETVQAAGTLIAINILALLIYAPSMGHAVFQSHSMLQASQSGTKAPTEEELRITEDLETAVEVHQKALDDLVNVNSLFTAAVFVGLAFANAGQQNIEGNKQCEAGVRVARRLVKNEVISFACYLFSSLVAKSLKTHLFTYVIPHDNTGIKDIGAFNDKQGKGLRGTLFALSTSTSVIGGVLLLYSMVDMIQLRLGKIACEGTETLNAVGALMAVNILAWVIYIPFVSHAIYKSTKIFDELQKQAKTLRDRQTNIN